MVLVIMTNLNFHLWIMLVEI